MNSDALTNFKAESKVVAKITEWPAPNTEYPLLVWVTFRASKTGSGGGTSCVNCMDIFRNVLSCEMT